MTTAHARPNGAAWRLARNRLAVLIALALAGCTHAPTNFSQYPGFAEYYAAHPRRTTAATAEEQTLLERFRPHFMLPAGHAGLIDFYRDYIAHGTLYAADGSVLSDRVTMTILNQHKSDPRVTFAHAPDWTSSTKPVVYARIDRERVAFGEHDQRELVFLTYHAVFRHSGLPAGVTGWRAGLLSVIADPDDWHQLDHYTAATVVLDARHIPIALLLQQHNYVRTYALGSDVQLDHDARPRIDVALRSNELYPHVPGRATRRAVRFITPEAMRYLMGFGPPPGISADDVTESSVEARYDIAYLPLDDAFYSFAGFLGARRRLPGRDGPPGADYNIYPELKPLGLQLVAGFFREANAEDLARFETSYEKTGAVLTFVRAQTPALGALLIKRD